MAETFKLSTQGAPSVSNQNARISAPTISTQAGMMGNAGAVQLDPRAGMLRPGQVPIPEQRDNMYLDGFTSFMKTAANAAMQFQEREAEYQANEVTVQYQDRVTRLYNGWEDEDGYKRGYGSTKGRETLALYGPFNETLDREFDALLEELEPRVKQRAMIKMQTARNTIRNKAVAHRLQEFEKLEESAETALRKRLEIEAYENPELLFTRNPVTDETLYAQISRQFDTEEEAAKYWKTFATEGVSRKYNLEHKKEFDRLRAEGDPMAEYKAAEIAFERTYEWANTYTALLTEGDIVAENAVFKELDRIKSDALTARSKLSQARRDELELAQEEREKSAKLYASQLMEDRRLGKQLPPLQVVRDNLLLNLPASQAQTFLDDIYGDQKFKVDPALNDKFTTQALTASLDMEALHQAVLDGHVTPDVQNSLIRLNVDSAKDALNAEVGEARKAVESIYRATAEQDRMRQKWRVQTKAEFEQASRDAVQQVDQCIRSHGRGSSETCLLRTKAYYDNAADSFFTLPEIRVAQGEGQKTYKPQTEAEWQEANAAFATLVVTNREHRERANQLRIKAYDYEQLANKQARTDTMDPEVAKKHSVGELRKLAKQTLAEAELVEQHYQAIISEAKIAETAELLERWREVIITKDELETELQMRSDRARTK